MPLLPVYTKQLYSPLPALAEAAAVSALAWLLTWGGVSLRGSTVAQ